MADEYRIMCKVVEMRGGQQCEAGHFVGEMFEFKERGTDMCVWAMTAAFPMYSVLKFGGSFPWEADPNLAYAACPDAGNPVIFELRRERI
jgi:uncharacterized repeat protein (TIGR04076 family)